MYVKLLHVRDLISDFYLKLLEHGVKHCMKLLNLQVCETIQTT